MTALLAVRDLTVGGTLGGRAVTLVDAVSFTVGAGQTYAIVGESGCGKSTTVRAVIRLLSNRARVTSGSVLFEGADLAKLDETAMIRVRGAGIGMVFQDPLSSLNPVLRIGPQIAEGLRYHAAERSGGAGRLQRVRDVMRLVGLPDPERIASAYPHELSGGQRQRVAIAIALACEPRLLLADEPTTALDVTIQDQILRLLSDLRRRLGMALVLVTHDLGVVERTCERVAVMYAGRIVEEGASAGVFGRPAHPYTAALLGSVPRGPRKVHALTPIAGMPPDPAHRPAGCGFAPRCARRLPMCATVVPPWTLKSNGEGFACFNPMPAGRPS